MDMRGRLWIPQEIRQKAGLQPGMPLEVTLKDGKIEIEPAPVEMELVQEGSFLVLTPKGNLPPMDESVIEATREALLRERGLIP
jgi:AbrB family looped-hinge helix DNA binding protein